MLTTGVYSVFKNTVEPRMSQTVVPVALRKSPYIIFYENTEIVANGLLKMCPRLEPQQHFEAACCTEYANVAGQRTPREGIDLLYYCCKVQCGERIKEHRKNLTIRVLCLKHLGALL